MALKLLLVVTLLGLAEEDSPRSGERESYVFVRSEPLRNESAIEIRGRVRFLNPEGDEVSERQLLDRIIEHATVALFLVARSPTGLVSPSDNSRESAPIGLDGSYKVRSAGKGLRLVRFLAPGFETASILVEQSETIDCFMTPIRRRN